MFESLTLVTMNISVITGILLGLVLHFKYERPKSVIGRFLILIGFALAPVTGVNTFIIAEGPIEGPLNGLCLSPFLFSMCLTMLICFIYRDSKLKRSIN